ncbi:MAG: heme exporter protein CcmB [Deltaproteobacteria bacterium]|nr:heme exporter protein CcmB [Deltaproteobacteria bacterium]
MLNSSRAIFRKDLKLMLGKGAGHAQAVLLGLLLIFMFSLTRGAAEPFSALAASTIFWVSTIFSLTLIFTSLYALEENHGQRQGLLLSPAPIQGVWLGKAMAGLVILFLTQLVFLPAAIIFLDQSIREGTALLISPGVILCVDLGLAAAGSLLGALAQGQAARESILGIIVFPLLLPLLLAAIRLNAMLPDGEYSRNSGGMLAWLNIVLAFDCLFSAAGLLLFSVVYRSQE